MPFSGRIPYSTNYRTVWGQSRSQVIPEVGLVFSRSSKITPTNYSHFVVREILPPRNNKYGMSCGFTASRVCINSNGQAIRDEETVEIGSTWENVHQPEVFSFKPQKANDCYAHESQIIIWGQLLR